MSADFIELADIVEALGGRPRIDVSRVTTSVLHNASYHIAMVACAFAVLDHSRDERVKNVDAAWIKLMQFVAGRPKLAEDLETYARSRRGRQRECYSLMPRGYLGDTSHEAVITYLVISGALSRVHGGLSRADGDSYLDTLFASIEGQDLFVAEREIMKSIQHILPSKALLGGK